MIDALKQIKDLTKSYAGSRILYIELCGFFLAVISSAMDEFYLFPFGVHTSLIETGFIFVFASVTIYLTKQLVERIKYLEGYLLICTICKHVRIADKWVSIEEAISSKSELQFSHGFCPSCADAMLRINDK